jgi:hypothetical protein
MRQTISILISGLISVARKACAPLVSALCGLIGGQTHDYRPERYYMRGPGPAWRAKQARVSDPR